MRFVRQVQNAFPQWRIVGTCFSLSACKRALVLIHFVNFATVVIDNVRPKPAN